MILRWEEGNESLGMFERLQCSKFGEDICLLNIGMVVRVPSCDVHVGDRAARARVHTVSAMMCAGLANRMKTCALPVP